MVVAFAPFTPLALSVVVLVAVVPFVAPFFVFVAPLPVVDVVTAATGSYFAVAVWALSSSHAMLTLDTAW